MLNYDAIIARIKKVIEDHDLNAASFAEKIGVQRSGISHILSGRNKPSLEFLSKIQATFKEVEYDWLLLGNPQPKEQAPTTLFENTDLKSEEKITKPKMTLNKNSEHTAPIKEIIYVYEDDSFKVIQRKS
ncbi:MAG: helix-turn-helix transcriptional regulator [Flavobacteriaceae bacterium]|nr:helix-turn-helix transcriptional regulator [Flavobacteriaceae bacterium]MDG1091653.1 helix-turn-helix transcriptional regulator [Flavobacteriaceae bacterium]